MFIKLFLLFTLGPLIELTLLLKIGSIFGVWHTVALVIITGAIGAFLARDQGLKVLREFQNSLAQGKIPTNPIVEGALILVSAALLVTPGMITDVIGFILVIPQSRKIVVEFLRKYFAAKIAQGAYTPGQSGGFYYRASYGSPPRKEKPDDKDQNVIDIE
jgi:UPF0716 protein FxsA